MAIGADDTVDLHPEIVSYWKNKGLQTFRLSLSGQWFVQNAERTHSAYIANIKLDKYRLDFEIGYKSEKWHSLEDALQLIKMKAFW
jgi:hypothetical protein